MIVSQISPRGQDDSSFCVTCYSRLRAWSCQSHWSRRVFGRHVHSSNLKIINDNGRSSINSYLIFTVSSRGYYETSIRSGWPVRESHLTLISLCSARIVPALQESFRSRKEGDWIGDRAMYWYTGRYLLVDPTVWSEYIKRMNRILNLVSTIITRMQWLPWPARWVSEPEGEHPREERRGVEKS